MNRSSRKPRLQGLRHKANVGGQMLLCAAMGTVFVLARTWGRLAWAREELDRVAAAAR